VRRYRRRLIGFAVFMATAVAMTWMVFATLQREVAGPTNTYSAIFTDVSGMAPGDDVRVAGVRVGRVDKIELAGTLAKVTFRVQRNQVLYTNTIASVTYQNIIGQRYLGLSQGPAGDQTPLPNLGQLPKERTNPSLDLSYVLNGFEPLFTQLDANQVDNLANAIIEALQGDSGSILVLTTQASALAETLAGPDQVLGDSRTAGDGHQQHHTRPTRIRRPATRLSRLRPPRRAAAPCLYGGEPSVSDQGPGPDHAGRKLHERLRV
jgi:phospholipid/cholesterol/gamma-HCH transport system substrate-binding protein